MRIAFVSYEFAGIGAGGGIGTYVRGAATMLANRGHQVEIFTSGAGRSDEIGADLRVHEIVADRGGFSATALAPFAARHAIAPFDVVEGPEYGADASDIAAAFPGLPLVVKLHTPSFLISEINNAYVPAWRKARFLLGGIEEAEFQDPIGCMIH